MELSVQPAYKVKHMRNRKAAHARWAWCATRCVAVFAVAALLVAPAYAGYDEGLAAYKRKDYETARKEMQPLADAGDPRAQVAIGYLYFHAHGLPQNDTEAFKWFRKAAMQGYAPGQAQLGVMYEEGYGTVRNSVEALKWYRLAAEQGEPAGQYGVGMAYFYGDGVDRDYDTALAWIRKSAAAGFVWAQGQLGFMYAHGLAVAQDWKQATHWYRIAAERNEWHAQGNLASAYERGTGVKQDALQAYFWTALAARHRDAHPMLAARRDALVAKLTDAERTQAKRLLEAWRPTTTPYIDENLNKESGGRQ